jgi:threonine dehydratase
MTLTVSPPVETAWPIGFAEVLEARSRIAPFLGLTPLRSYETLDHAVGHGVRVFVKHENFQPTGAFKIRNALSVMTALSTDDRARGVIAATRGNHGLGVSWAARAFGVPATICVPIGNSPDKNAGIRALGARLIEEGGDYDEALAVAHRIVHETGARMIHSTNDPHVIAGAATMSLEMIEQEPTLDALVISVGGGSQAVGALTVLRERAPLSAVYGVQAAGASASHDSWHAGEVRSTARADTFADGLATRTPYELTFPALRAGLAGFLTVTDAEIAAALRLLLSTSHTLVEGAGAAGLAGLIKLAPTLAGKRVGVVISGGNIDRETLARVVNGEI